MSTRISTRAALRLVLFGLALVGGPWLGVAGAQVSPNPLPREDPEAGPGRSGPAQGKGERRGQTKPPGTKILDVLLFMVGRYQGRGKLGERAFVETISTRWELGDNVLVWRGEAVGGGRRIHEDQRVFTVDQSRNVIVMRQITATHVRRFDLVRVKQDPKALVAVQRSIEGPKAAELRFIFKPTRSGFQELVQQKTEQGFRGLLAIDFRRMLSDPAESGPLRPLRLGIRVPFSGGVTRRLSVHLPRAGRRTMPVVVLAPGKDAAERARAEGLARHLATHGVVSLLLAGEEAAVAATDFRGVVDWLVASLDRKGSPFKGRVALDQIVFMGHGASGTAALEAAGLDERCAGVATILGADLAMPAGARRPALCIVSKADETDARALVDGWGESPRLHLSTVPGDNRARVLRSLTGFVLGLVAREPAMLELVKRLEKDPATHVAGAPEGPGKPARPGDAKPGDAKPDESKPDDAKPGDKPLEPADPVPGRDF